MALQVSRSVAAAIIAEANRAHPEEACGLLFGDGAGCISQCRISQCRPATNVAANTTLHFELDPRLLIDAERTMRAGGPRLLGYYHSHPKGGTEPSQTDANQSACDGRIWAIVAGDAVAFWKNVEGGAVKGAFDPVNWSLIDDGLTRKAEAKA